MYRINTTLIPDIMSVSYKSPTIATSDFSNPSISKDLDIIIGSGLPINSG